jgi:hypothetical protein
MARRCALAGALVLAVALAACTSGASASSASRSSASQNSASKNGAPVARVTAPGPSLHDGLRSFAFPPGVTVLVQATLPASGARRSAVIGYENYVRSLWDTVATHGSSTAYQGYLFGDALAFAHAMIHEVTEDGYKLHGTIVYHDISVPRVYHDAGAVVDACVNAGSMYLVTEKTGKVAGTVFGKSFDRYREQVSDGREAGGRAGPGGSWVVTRTDNIPAPDGGAAAHCS